LARPDRLPRSRIPLSILRYALAFAAGAMLYVVVEELVPEITRGGNVDQGTLRFMFGFAAMVSLDNAFS
jgi:ZIP family zinc transporter